jgi:hypothetical protein
MSTRGPCDGRRGEAVHHPRFEVVRGLNAAEGREVEGYNCRYHQVITAKPRGPLTADMVLCGIQHFWMRGSALEEPTSEHVMLVRASLRPRIVAPLWCRRVWGPKGISNAEEE